MKLAIIGTAGIPAKYGGFETLVEYLTKHNGLKIETVVYCSSKIYNKKLQKYNGVELKYLPLSANGIQSILYDILSFFSAAKKGDILLVLGVSGCIILPFFRLFYPQKIIITNIDGLEHKREKWKKIIQKFLKYSEKQAIKYSDIIIADNRVIQKYVMNEYQKDSIYIAYGGNHTRRIDLLPEIKAKYSLPRKYAFKVCRIEPENNIHLILKAFSESLLPLVLIGNWDRSNYGIKLRKQYSIFSNLYLLNPIYHQNTLNQLRSNCYVYIHGHSAGGTNPSLVEAMSLGLPILAYDIEYNRETTMNRAYYFNDENELKELLNKLTDLDLIELKKKMKEIARENYTWEKIAAQYFELFQSQ